MVKNNLYSLKKNKTNDKSTEEIEYEKAKEYCTFKPNVAAHKETDLNKQKVPQKQIMSTDSNEPESESTLSNKNSMSMKLQNKVST